jgi:sugar/nucleoside kinase (ribokinase family)
VNFEVCAIGNAIVDVISFVSDEFLEKNNLTKGSMSLIDEKKAITLSKNLKIEKICAGGSAANTAYILGQKGLKTTFIGKIADDEYGEIFLNSLLQQNINFHHLSKGKNQTARSFILVSPDGQRTMATFLGDAGNIENQINQQLIKSSKIFYIEGYLWDLPSSIKYLKEAIEFAKANNIKIAFTLSDLFCVSRHQDDFLKIFSLADIVFANKDEALSLFKDGEFLDNAINNKTIFIVTKDKDGVDIFDGISEKHHKIKVNVVENVADTTGAGDAFAAGFLYGICKNEDLEKSAKIGNDLARKIIQVIGAKL